MWRRSTTKKGFFCTRSTFPAPSPGASPRRRPWQSGIGRLPPTSAGGTAPPLRRCGVSPGSFRTERAPCMWRTRTATYFLTARRSPWTVQPTRTSRPWPSARRRTFWTCTRVCRTRTAPPCRCGAVFTAPSPGLAGRCTATPKASTATTSGRSASPHPMSRIFSAAGRRASPRWSGRRISSQIRCFTAAAARTGARERFCAAFSGMTASTPAPWPAWPRCSGAGAPAPIPFASVCFRLGDALGRIHWKSAQNAGNFPHFFAD